MTTATRPRVLLLDWLGHYSEAWLQDAKEMADLVTFGRRDSTGQRLWYEIPGTGIVACAEAVANAVAKETYDLIFLGNNMGAGVDIAKLLPSDAKAKTYVVSHLGGVAGDVQRKYQELGITRPDQFMMRRTEILDKLRGLVMTK